jgi:hypothetical protein
MRKKVTIRMAMKILPSILYIISAVLVITADGGDTEQLHLGYALVKKTKMSNMYIELAEAFLEPYFEQHDAPDTADSIGRNPLKEIFSEEVKEGEEELRWMLAGIYAQHFSEEELRKIVDFFDSPAGEAWLRKKLIIETEAEQIGLEWGKLLTQRVLQKFNKLQRQAQ